MRDKKNYFIAVYTTIQNPSHSLGVLVIVMDTFQFSSTRGLRFIGSHTVWGKFQGLLSTTRLHRRLLLT